MSAVRRESQGEIDDYSYSLSDERVKKGSRNHQAREKTKWKQKTIHLFKPHQQLQI